MCLSLLSTKKKEWENCNAWKWHGSRTQVSSQRLRNGQPWTGKYLTSVSQFQLEEGDASHSPACCDDQKTQRWAVCPTGELRCCGQADSSVQCGHSPASYPAHNWRKMGKILDSALQTGHSKKPLKAQAVTWCYTCPGPTRACWEPRPGGRERCAPLAGPALPGLTATDQAGTQTWTQAHFLG